MRRYDGFFRRASVVSAAVVVLLVSPAEGRAQTAETTAAAHFQRGIEHSDVGELPQALDAFRRAYLLAPHPKTLLNVARLAAALQADTAAYEAFAMLLEKHGAELDKDDRREAEAARKELAAGLLLLRVSVRPADAAVVVDGTPRAASTLALAPGEHRVEITREGFLPEVFSVHGSAGQSLETHASLEPQRAPAAKATKALPARATKTAPKGQTGEPANTGPALLPWLAVTALAAGGTASGLWIWNAGRRRDWQQRDGQQRSLPAASQERREIVGDMNALASSVNVVSVVAASLAVVAVAASGTAAYVHFSRAGGSGRPTASIGLQGNW